MKVYVCLTVLLSVFSNDSFGKNLSDLYLEAISESFEKFYDKPWAPDASPSRLANTMKIKMANKTRSLLESKQGIRRLLLSALDYEVFELLTDMVSLDDFNTKKANLKLFSFFDESAGKTVLMNDQSVLALRKYIAAHQKEAFSIVKRTYYGLIEDEIKLTGKYGAKATTNHLLDVQKLIKTVGPDDFSLGDLFNKQFERSRNHLKAIDFFIDSGLSISKKSILNWKLAKDVRYQSFIEALPTWKGVFSKALSKLAL